MVSAEEVEAAEKLKLLGNTKLAQQDYDGAVEHFSKAIAKNSANHIYFSNRSAALMYQEKFHQALQDAESCIKLAPNWGKGWARKGAALEALGKEEEAGEAYAKARECGFEVTKPSPSPAGVGKSRSLLSATVLFVARLFLILCLFLYPLDKRAFKWCLLTSLFVLVFQLRSQHGWPKFDQEYARKIFFDYRFHYAIVATTMLISHPFVLVMLPLRENGSDMGMIVDVLILVYLLVVFSEVGHVADYFDQNVRKVLPSLVAKLDGLVAATVPMFVGASPPEWETMCTSGKWDLFNQAALNLCASFEVVTLLSLFVELMTPDRNFLVLVLYCQFLRLRYILSPEVKQVCVRLDSRFRFALGDIPLVGRAYDKLSSGIHSLAALPTPGAQQQRRCSIM